MRNLALMWVLAACLLGCGGKSDVKPAPPSVSTFTDTRDGKVYNKVEIGTQVWMAENLNYAVEGSKCLGEGGEVIIDWDEKANPIKTKTLSNSEIQANCEKYGRLYTWNAAMTACPVGWYLPTNDEWQTLEDYAGGARTAGTKLKSSTGWETYNGKPDNGTDEYGFSALPGDYGKGDGSFNGVGDGYWWSATECDNHALFRMVRDVKHYFDTTYLLSVRCVQDDEKEKRK